MNNYLDINFENIKKVISEIYEEQRKNSSGAVATYIPKLEKVNPNLFGISVCTVNGETFDIGDSDIDFCLQSCCKPFLYAIAKDLNGTQKVHKHVGYEPSGQRFNAFILNDDKLPHNPMINAGAIMTSSLIKPAQEPADRYECVLEYFKKMGGPSSKFSFDNGVFLSEREHADRNQALAFYMRENNAFSDEVSGKEQINKTLEFYFQMCSVTANSQSLSRVAATLANGGVCSTTQQRVFNKDIVRDTLTLMYSCGMYDYSGRFSFEVGLPAKSGVSGCILLVVPNIMGICIWSPPLDKLGNSVRGLNVCKSLTKKFQFHIFERLINRSDDIHIGTNELSMDIVEQLFITAASKGDVEKVQLYLDKNVNVNAADYDKRSAIHLASAEGHIDVVKLLLDNGVDPSVKDRWGTTPEQDATVGKHENIIELLKNHVVD